MGFFSNVKSRVNLLYCLFFAFVVIGVVFSTFSEGFVIGWNDGLAMFEEDNVNKSSSTIIYDVNLDRDYADFNIDLPDQNEDLLEISARSVLLDLRILARSENPYNNPFTTIFAFLVVGIYIVIYVLLFKMIISLRKSIKNKNLFSKKNILRVRTIGFLLIVYSLSGSFFLWLNNRGVEKLFENSTYSVDTSFQIDCSGLLFAILILFIGEIFAVGYSISEEQKLTI